MKKMNNEKLFWMYKKMLLIRRFEERVIDTLIAELGFTGLGVGAEIAYRITNQEFDHLYAPVERVTPAKIFRCLVPIIWKKKSCPIPKKLWQPQKKFYISSQ